MKIETRIMSKDVICRFDELKPGEVSITAVSST